MLGVTSVDGALTLKNRMMTVPETKNPPPLQPKSTPEVLEQQINTTKCT